MNFAALVPELFCSDFGQSLHFYTKQLGFSIKYETPEDSFAYLERQQAQIMLQGIGAHYDWVCDEISYPFGRGINLKIHANRVQELYDGLQQAGHKFFLPLENKWYRKGDNYIGNRQFIIRDPDGYLIRFSQDLGIKTAMEFQSMEKTL